MIRTVFGAERQAVSRHSSDVMIPSATACLTAVLTVERLTPARTAIWPMVSRQRPRRVTSVAITDRTAVSAIVNRAAKAGGSQPEPVQRRRRSMCAGDRGREPTGFLGAVGVGGMAFLAWISSARACASSSPIAPQAKPFHTAAASSGSRVRGVAVMARLISSANISTAPCWGRFGRERRRSGKRRFPR